MKGLTNKIIILVLFANIFVFAQIKVKDQESSPNILLQVNDEGTSGSLLLPPLPSSPGDVDQKLYNIAGNLFWNGNQVGTSFTAAGWTYDGINILTTTLNDKVGIGMGSAPSVKLSLGLDITPKKLALFDGSEDFYGFGVDWGRITIYTNNTEKMTIEDNGDVGIGTNNPDAKLDVNGDVRVGINGIKFSEIYELTGTTGGIGTSDITVPLPAGYSDVNTRVLCLEISTAFGWISIGNRIGPNNLSYIIGGTSIAISYENSTVFQSRPFRILMMKVE
jgi:hypothetical protein